MIHERLNAIEEASPEESAEILELIDSLSEEDRQVVRVEQVVMYNSVHVKEMEKLLIETCSKTEK